VIAEPAFEAQSPLLLAGCPQFGDTGKVCPSAAWDRLFAIRLQAGLPKVGPVGYGVLVLPPEFPANDHQHYYYAAFAATPETEGNPAFFLYRVPQCQLAVFALPGNDYGQFGAVQRHAHEVWLPSSGYALAGPFSFERYTNGKPYKVDVCFPVKRR
jgi:predicted transcriptional regulator YdeE